jgi:hypothetical protein
MEAAGSSETSINFYQTSHPSRQYPHTKFCPESAKKSYHSEAHDACGRDNEPNGWLHELPGICALTERLQTVVAELD